MDKNTDKQAVKEAPIMDTKKVNGSVLMKIVIPRNLEKGFEITLQSPINWAAVLAKKPEKLLNIGQVPCFAPDKQHLDGINGVFLTESLFTHEDFPNLNMLLARDLKTGVTFNFGMIPVSQDNITDWVAKFREQVKMIYLSFFKPLNISCTISSHTVEEEVHD